MTDTTDEYAELKAATPDERLGAAICFWKHSNPGAEEWIRLGFALAQLDGWKHVAPYWLRMWRENKDWQPCPACGRKMETNGDKMDCHDCADYELAYSDPAICPQCGTLGERDDLGGFCPYCENEWEI